ncbi:hypothetical protein [Amycolatopsis sp. cmx-4-61]|uniref:hypothetical protein n=1 Tax=Amycolatopsis sp. cmx-4-61 TaxID=2790937 RepID=UPI00397965EB
MTVGVRGYWVFGSALPRGTRLGVMGRPVARLVLLVAGRQGADAGGLGDDVGDADPALVLHRPAPSGPGARGTVEVATGSRAVELVRHSVSFRAIEGGGFDLAVFPRRR